MMIEVYKYMRLNNADELESTEFKSYTSPDLKGALLVNLLDLKNRYQYLIEHEENYHDLLILKGKLLGIKTIIEESGLYSQYYDRLQDDYYKAISNIFIKISDFRNKSKKYLYYKDRNEALIYCAASEEINNIVNIIEKEYLMAVN